MWLHELLAGSKTTLRSAGARACGNHQAIDISTRWGEERRTTSVALQVESANCKSSSERHHHLQILTYDCPSNTCTRRGHAHARLWQVSCSVLGEMNVGYIKAIAALAGAAIGGLTSLANSWAILHAQMKAQRLASSRSSRQELYKQFIDEASRTYVDALVHDKLDVSGLVGIYSLISKMRVLSSQKVIESAAGIAILITDTYFQPNKTPTELQAMMHDCGVDPLLDFSDVCRQELETDLLA